MRGGVLNRNSKAAVAPRFSSTTFYPAGSRHTSSPMVRQLPGASRIESLTFTIRRQDTGIDWNPGAGRGVAGRRRGTLNGDGRCGAMRWSSRFQRVARWWRTAGP
jgi:hypothetical protein